MIKAVFLSEDSPILLFGFSIQDLDNLGDNPICVDLTDLGHKGHLAFCRVEHLEYDEVLEDLPVPDGALVIALESKSIEALVDGDWVRLDVEGDFRGSIYLVSGHGDWGIQDYFDRIGLEGSVSWSCREFCDSCRSQRLVDGSCSCADTLN